MRVSSLAVIIKTLLVFYVLIQNLAAHSSPDSCFCQLKGQIDDCSCNIDNVDDYNNAKIYPRLRSLLVNDYFRYFKVNLAHECPFWADDSKCSLRDCSVQTCTEDQVPEGLKGSPSSKAEKYLNNAQAEDSCGEHHLGVLNSSISDETFEEFEKWKVYDDTNSAFCQIDDEFSSGMKYVDLLLNPERYTGYKGPSAHRVWNSIYKENCFQPDQSYGIFSSSQFLENSTPQPPFLLPAAMCLEKRTFYRAVSGLHTSINIHLCANYLLPALNEFTPPKWGLNFEEFNIRFDPKFTAGEGPLRLKNLYFLYLLELRALAKAAPYLEKFEYYTGNENDADVKVAVNELLNIITCFPNHFDESVMFADNTKEAHKLKEEFRLHFRNISKIMDCVGCDKCRLWGKLQTQGLGTAFKILFSDEKQGTLHKEKGLQLKRTEVVSLFNAFGRLSTSIYELENIRKLHR